jgi:hypothetical protein
MTELAQYQPRQIERTATDTDSWTGVLHDIIELAKGIANTSFVPDGYRGDVASVTAIILKGREMGVPPMAALAHISNIKGRPAQSAELMRAQVLRAGHSLIVDESSSSTRAKVRGCRRGETEWQTASFTADEAKQRKIPLTGLDKSGNPSGYGPEEKLVARATSRLCRRMFANVVAFGLPPADELEDVDAPPPPATSPSHTVQRKVRAEVVRAEPDTPEAPVESKPDASADDDGPPLEDESPTAAQAARARAWAAEDRDHSGDSDQIRQAPRPVVDGSAGSLQVPPITAPPNVVNETTGELSSGAPMTVPDAWDAPAATPRQPQGPRPVTKPGEAITDRQQRMLMALFNGQGLKEHDVRMAWLAGVVGREVSSTNDLTVTEASTAIDALKEGKE